MCEPTLIYAGVTAVAGAYSAYNQYQQGVAESKMYGYQAQVARQEGDLALRTGAKQSELIQDTAKMQGKSLKTEQAEFNASQSAAAAASGVGGGTLEDIASSTLSKEQLDEAMLRYNANIKSWETEENAKFTNWSKQSEATQYDFAKKNAKKAGARNAFASLLGTASTVSGAFLPAKKKE
jgi:hypothetical protein